MGWAPHSHLRKSRRLLEDQQSEMSNAIAAHFPVGSRATRPRGGYFLWVELPSGVDAMVLYRRALEEGISLAPGPLFSASGEYRNCIRLNYGLPSGRNSPTTFNSALYQTNVFWDGRVARLKNGKQQLPTGMQAHMRHSRTL